MSSIIMLDSGPLGLLMQRHGIPVADACRAWLANHLKNGVHFIVPEIADYEVRRELLRLRKSAAVTRLDSFNAADANRYLPMTTAAIRKAAELWAETRRLGFPTADPKELDGDVILAGQAMTCALPIADIAVATTNPVHLKRFVKAELWNTL